MFCGEKKCYVEEFVRRCLALNKWVEWAIIPHSIFESTVIIVGVSNYYILINYIVPISNLPMLQCLLFPTHPLFPLC